MVLVSKIHGEIEYEHKDIITFEKGILGLEDLKKFLLVKLEQYEPFYLLQSIEDEDIGFILACPFDFYNQYEFDLKEDLIERLDIKNQEDVTIFTTVTLNSNVSKITTNLKAPIIINISNKLGEQIILDKEKYQIKHPLMRE
ncbi:flagellar assembly protein FliW [Clostridium sp. SM-530-WT-3G]|uniref:flagellar assembly protein FliW n=1 Tax=Clostridium sp. SM-530-WT-3G TaxID=2725303 RepID=UPI00145D4AF3|nr:flagellar assembly protein FliW [Clostridium sp. SM-530-WT-3G]NME82799.1 flagellar assembly protein FliW [Clostridium sp. SM-530-WT-3G]